MIKAEALSRTYGDVVAVNQVSFEIGRGEIVGLLGHNGAGKTTIMKMVTGFLEPSSGSISVNGKDAYANRLQIQGQIGYLPENCPLYPEMSVLGFLEYAAMLRGVPESQTIDRIRYAVDKTKLLPVAQKPINTLSRGYRQRLGVAQAILNAPTILILDEPTNGLDPSQILEMRSLIKELAETATVVISTHILQEVRAVCGRVIIINNGRVALDAAMDQLETAGRILISVNQPPSECLSIFEKVGNMKLIDQYSKSDQYFYTIEPQGEHVRSMAPQIARALVENGADIYAIQPLVRDLEVVFGEITAGNNGATAAIGKDLGSDDRQDNASASPELNASEETARSGIQLNGEASEQ